MNLSCQLNWIFKWDEFFMMRLIVSHSNIYTTFQMFGVSKIVFFK